jgi:GntR family transcriptional regulator/MocR family aminotransferase
MPRLERVPSAAGLHLAALLRDGSSAPVVAAARAAGLAVDNLPDYAGQDGFVFGFGAVDPATIDDGLALFASLLDRHA